MKRTARSGAALLVAGALLSLTACGDEVDDLAVTGTGEVAAACVFQAEYRGRTYQDAGLDDRTGKARPAIGRKLGDAVLPPCHDTGRDNGEEATVENAYAIEGVRPEDAIAVGTGPDDAVLVTTARNGGLPPALRKLLDGK
ncbi:DUF6281 family protein [Streptomyces sp. JNUCC 64]